MGQVRALRNGMVEVFNRMSGKFDYIEKCDTLYWNDGLPLLYSAATGRYQQLGRAYIKANWKLWAKQHGVDFREESPS